MQRLQPKHAKFKHLMGDEQTVLPLLRMLSSCRLFSMVGSSNHGKSAQKRVSVQLPRTSQKT